jgi:hypothetical protein
MFLLFLEEEENYATKHVFDDTADGVVQIYIFMGLFGCLKLFGVPKI